MKNIKCHLLNSGQRSCRTSNASTLVLCFRALLNISNQGFLVFLHIDEFQMIDKLEKKDMTAFKDMINGPATFMTNRLEAFVQTFLSGTASQVVISTMEPSRVSFHFVECPLLSMTSMIKILQSHVM
nr:13628_t:CDS:1 [Entrophospora candida]